MRRSYLIPLLLAALLCGCTQEAAANSTASHSDTATSSANTDIFSARDLEIGYDADTAASHGLVGKDAVAIAGGTFRLETGKDGVQSDHENTDKGWIYLAGGDFTVVSDGDGFSASSTLTVVGGSYTLTTGGGRENGKTHADDAFPGGGRGGMIGPGG